MKKPALIGFILVLLPLNKLYAYSLLVGVEVDSSIEKSEEFSEGYALNLNLNFPNKEPEDKIKLNSIGGSFASSTYGNSESSILTRSGRLGGEMQLYDFFLGLDFQSVQTPQLDYKETERGLTLGFFWNLQNEEKLSLEESDPFSKHIKFTLFRSTSGISQEFSFELLGQRLNRVFEAQRIKQGASIAFFIFPNFDFGLSASQNHYSFDAEKYQRALGSTFIQTRTPSLAGTLYSLNKGDVSLFLTYYLLDFDLFYQITELNYLAGGAKQKNHFIELGYQWPIGLESRLGLSRSSETALNLGINYLFQ